MNRKEVEDYFTLLESTMEENSRFDKPTNIFNIDKTGLQLKNRPDEVLVNKGAKPVYKRGKTVALVVSYNTEGNFLPPAVIMKRKNKKESGKMAYHLVLFYLWHKKPPISTQLFCFNELVNILSLENHQDGHVSHVNSVEMLSACAICNLFKSLKAHLYESCRLWLRNHAGRRITRSQFKELLNTNWDTAATTQNGSSSFKATEFYPSVETSYQVTIFLLMKLPRLQQDTFHRKNRQSLQKNQLMV
ncbi:hypothetical protein Trydic_g7485 [Trypoxylus dichotomus]